ncbi:MAG: response regulator [Spirochaetes bacterium]|nr:response regulator [Spirochaetota bacterium]MBU1079968.1 response regulator [Spirochaetota bacterium]
MDAQTHRVLLVEDNPDHAEMVMRSFREHQKGDAIHRVADGEEALDYLFRQGRYADPLSSPRPELILLDLRLPKVDGLEVLVRLKTAEGLKRIPVIILTTSESEVDLVRAYDGYANSYLVKPVDFDKFIRLMGDLGLYWLGWNHLA